MANFFYAFFQVFLHVMVVVLEDVVVETVGAEEAVEVSEVEEVVLVGTEIVLVVEVEEIGIVSADVEVVAEAEVEEAVDGEVAEVEVEVVSKEEKPSS